MEFNSLPVGSRFIEQPRRTERDKRGIKVVFRKVRDGKARSMLTLRLCTFKPGTKVQRITR